MTIQHWHIDITYLSICGTFYYLCALLDGYSRYIVHFEIKVEQMKEADVEIIIQRARDALQASIPRIISDNGPQFIAKEFKTFVRNDPCENHAILPPIQRKIREPLSQTGVYQLLEAPTTSLQHGYMTSR